MRSLAVGDRSSFLMKLSGTLSFCCCFFVFLSWCRAGGNGQSLIRLMSCVIELTAMGLRDVKVAVPDNHGTSLVCRFNDAVLSGLQRLECNCSSSACVTKVQLA